MLDDVQLIARFNRLSLGCLSVTSGGFWGMRGWSGAVICDYRLQHVFLSHCIVIRPAKERMSPSGSTPPSEDSISQGVARWVNDWVALVVRGADCAGPITACLPKGSPLL